jgi:hypothetical protein
MTFDLPHETNPRIAALTMPNDAWIQNSHQAET